MINKQIAKWVISLIAAVSLPAYAMPELAESATVPPTACYQAKEGCLLLVKPSPWRNGQRQFALAAVCENKMPDLPLLYYHELKMKDQITRRLFLGRTFCHGVVSLSDMHLPFAKGGRPFSFKDANDGILVINLAESGLKQVRSLLIDTQSLAKEAASATTPASQENIAEFDKLLNEINRLAITLNVDGFEVLRPYHDDPTAIPIHHGKDKVVINLTRASTGHDGLNIAMLTIASVADAKAALPPLANAITTIETGIEKLEQSRPALEAAVNADETVTIVDLSGPQFIVKQTS